MAGLSGWGVHRWIMLGILTGSTLVPRRVDARVNGMDGGSCEGCHARLEFDIRVVPSPAVFSPGEEVQLTVELRGSAPEAGLFITEIMGAGAFSTVTGGGLGLRGAGMTHTSPRALSDGVASFTLRWQAPAEPGAARFTVSGVLANGDRRNSGDQAWGADFDFVFGCESQVFYADFDRDGYGRPGHDRLFCAGAPPDGYAATDDDCDDNRETVYPGAIEACNLRDDDCNGEIDNDQVPVMQYPDADGDGFYGIDEALSSEAFLGCPRTGFASESGDCQPRIAEMHPGAEEICNLYDDNCDGRIDEFVRPQCGVGWCRRNSNSCEPEDCVPGEPSPEVCNLLDDDCDDLVDEGEDLCDAGEACQQGQCLPEMSASSTGGTTSGEGGVAPDATETSGTTSMQSGLDDTAPIPGATSSDVDVDDDGPIGPTTSRPPGLPAADEDSPSTGCSCNAYAPPTEGHGIGAALLLWWLRRRRRTVTGPPQSAADGPLATPARLNRDR